ncbi:Stk1 family PASTA domain-containing Ser/Thr kinase [Micrococcales bacterium 31B]|nr:Stk1 family PASTA domain-containing Ser/Thr kinase [Micrococcales bacterium 31B]
MNNPGIDPLVGRVIDRRYTVQGLVAHGGMATVYVALDNRLEREVALKVLHPHLAENHNFVRRFYREAKLAAGISNPHIVSMFDQGQDGDLCFLAMEYVPGQTLRGLLQSRPDPNRGIDDDMVMALAIPIVEALVAAHEAGLVHRDIKPENVLISRSGRVKVADFGLARAAGTSTATSTVLGTVAYAAPEVLHADTPDHRSDMYSLGIMLFELVTGHLPFVGDAPLRVAFQQVNEPIQPPSAAYAGSSATFDEIILWTAAKNPVERPDTARELLHRLRSLTPLDDRALTETLRRTAPLPLSAATPANGSLAEKGSTTALPQPVPRRPDRIKAAPVASTTPPSSALAQRRRRRRTWAIPVATVLVLGLGAGGYLWYTEYGPGSLRTLPAVANLALADANRQISTSSLQTRTVEQFSDTVPAGTVIGTVPGAGQVSKDAVVTLTVSKGPEFTLVPLVEGKTQADAEAALKKAGLGVSVPEPQYSEDVAEGLVIKQTFQENERVKSGTQVEIVVSKGREPITVPTDLAGKTRDEAKGQIEGADLTYAATEQFSDTVAAGVVISQEPTSGTLFRGDTVTVVVSKGPELVQVPRVIGKSEADAKQELADAGFEVAVTYSPFDAPVLDIVRTQSLEGGTMVRKGSTITLGVV